MATMPGPILGVWFGKYYANAPYLMTIFCISAQFNLLTGAGSSIFRGIGRVREEFFYAVPNCFILAVTVPLSYVVLGQWSAVGIATAVAASTCLAALIFLARANKLLQVPLRLYLKAVIIPGLAPYLVALPLSIPAYILVTHASRLGGASYIACICLLYAISSVALIVRFVFEPGERLWFKAMLSETLGRFRRPSPLRHDSLEPEGR